MIEKLIEAGKNLQFVNPEYFQLFSVVYLLITLWVIVFAIRYKNRAKKTVGSRHSLISRVLRFCLIVIVAVIPLSIVALARPYIPEGPIKFNKGAIEVVFLIDDSISMWVKDVTPSRIGVAVREIIGVHSQEIIRDGDRAALVVFGKTSLKKIRLSKDLSRFSNEISKIGPPQHLVGDDHPFASDIPLVLEDTYQFLDRQDNIDKDVNWRPSQRPNRIVLLFGDGDYRFEEYSPNDKKRLAGALTEFRKRGLSIFSVGVGTRQGVRLVSALDGYKKDNDFDAQIESDLVEQGVTRLDPMSLNFLSAQTGGSTFMVENNSVSAEVFIRAVIDSRRMPSIEISSEQEKQELWWEVLALAVLVIFLGIIFY